MQQLNIPAIVAWIAALILVSPAMVTNLFESSTTIHHPNIRLILWICYAILWVIFISYLLAPNRIWDHLRERKNDYFVLIGTVIVLLVLIEFGWQVSKQVDVSSSEMNITNYEYEYTLELNSYGFRDVEFSKGKSGNTKRMLLYGDEIVFGEGVLENQKIDALMETRLNKRKDGNTYQVYALGHPGDTPDRHPKYIKEMPKIIGDIAIFVFNVDNDIISGTASFEGTQEGAGAVLDSLHVPKLITRDIKGNLCTTIKGDEYPILDEYEQLLCDKRIDSSIVLDPNYAEVQDRYNYNLLMFQRTGATQEAILEIKNTARAGKFILVLSPSKYQLGEEHFSTLVEGGLVRQTGPVDRQIQDALIAWAEEEGIEVLDLLPMMQESNIQPFYEISQNYNAEGNALIADVLISVTFP